VEIGSGLNITSEGVLDTAVQPSVELPKDVSTTEAETGVSLKYSREDHVHLYTPPAPYELPIATTTALGGIKPDGTTITVNSSTGVATAAAAEPQAQADWNETDDAKPDFIKNKPTIPAAQVNSDWNASSGVAQILNKPTIPSPYTLPIASTTVLGGIKPDGTTIKTDPETGITTASVSTDHQYILIGENGAMLSSDLENWTRVLDSTFPLKTITYSDGMGIVAGNGTKFFLSILGNKWINFDTGISQNINSVINTPQGWAAVCDDGVLLVSDDGFSWNPAEFTFPGAVNDIVWNPVVKEFFAVGNSFNGTALIYRSLDLTGGWTSVYSDITDDLYSVAVNDAGNMVATGSNSAAVYSENGDSWEIGRFPYGITCVKVTYKNNLFLAAGGPQGLAKSSDGITWEPVPTIFLGDFKLLTYEDGLYIGGGTGNIYFMGADINNLQLYNVPLGTIYGIAKYPVLPGMKGIINLLNIMDLKISALENMSGK
jgi:hypothetical protein